MQVITEILDGKTFHQCASRIDEFYCLKFGDTCITRKNIRFISYVNPNFTIYTIYIDWTLHATVLHVTGKTLFWRQ